MAAESAKPPLPIDGKQQIFQRGSAEETSNRAARNPFLIVGVGASAGGLEALERFFDGMSPDSGFAFVVVQHLSPDFKSLMDELLSRHTKIAIHRVEDGMEVKPNAIYLIPPRKEMIVSGGKLHLTDKDPDQTLNLPIDTFFRSLAQDCGKRAVGIILSGTGSDGSRGVRKIHEAGGLVIVQDEATAKFYGMPRAALETGVVDYELPPEAIPGVLLEYSQDLHAGLSSEVSTGPKVSEDGISAIYSLLRRDYSIDFSHYKPSTVTRRIERRLNLNQSPDVEDYVRRLKEDPQELNSLYKDLLIGVTKFFRDQEAYEVLSQELLPQLISGKNAEDEFRVWIAGCATGEEAYSIAIVLHEALADHPLLQSVKIFATDVHRASLEFASAGVYTAEAVSEVSPDRLKRYFQRRGKAYHVAQELRKMIVFAPHNVIKDAPFTKLDLVCCRNLLIYFQPHVQKKVLSLFHFGLRTGGALFLGPSEGPGEIAEEFEIINSHWKIYRKRRDIRLPADVRLPISSTLPRLRDSRLQASTLTTGLPESGLLRVYDLLLKEHLPACLLVDQNRHLVHSFAGAGKFLKVPDGRTSQDILNLVAPDLRIALSGALQRAASMNETVVLSGVEVREEDHSQHYRLTVRPVLVKVANEPYFLIFLERQEKKGLSEKRASQFELDDVSRERMVEIEEELQFTKENLQATVEEMETTNEELQATNEELVASNEELQSTNEELHSVNEELHTVNAEYQRKISELTQMTDDMDNLLRSTDLGTIFLDRGLCIRKFTPKITQLFQILPQDVGRSLESFTHNINYDFLLDDVRRVMETDRSLEKDVRDRKGNAYLMRILPYRAHAAVEGVVLTFIDIDTLKQAERELLRMSKVFMDGADPIIIEDLEGKILDVNAESVRVYGWSREELIGQSVFILIPQNRHEQSHEDRQRCKSAEPVRNVETVRMDRQGVSHPILLTLSLITDEEGKPIGIASISKEITRLKQAEAAAQEAAHKRDQFLAMLSHELRNPLAAVMNAVRVVNREDVSPDHRQQACQVLLKQTGQMSRLLDDLLDVSRVTQGKIEIRREIVELNALLEDSVEAVKPLIESRRHQLHVQTAPEPLYVVGDSARLLQVIENLLTNAAKYTPPGRNIWLSLAKKKKKAVLEVRDEGEGIPAELKDKIFDLFEQVDKTLERSDGGMGVGLTLVKSLVEFHGGNIVVNSAGRGKGSTFIVRLPLTAKRSTVGEPASSDGKAVRKVLIVEDNPDSRNMLKMLLELEGFDVGTAANGKQGLECILNNPPEVALIDIGLPELNGYEVAQKVRVEMPETRVRLVALTGYGRESDRQAAFAAGFDDHLVKPVKPQDLARVLAFE